MPFGANVIVGHPGETESTMRTSAAYLRDLFLGDPRGTMGFLSVDPFRLYPGSPIDEERDAWERDTGMQVHRYPWWHDGDQDFLAEWVAPSSELDFRTTLRLKRELFDPILLEIPKRFAYQGPARDYFMRAIDEQVELASPRRYLHVLGMWHLWRELTGADPAFCAGVDLKEVAGETPPTASTMSLNPLKSTTAKWLMNRPVFASTVLIVHAGPPMANAALNCCTGHWFLGTLASQFGGIFTIESRGIDTTVTCWRSAETWATRVVSERAPDTCEASGAS